jgi:hypothetical protein
MQDCPKEKFMCAMTNIMVAGAQLLKVFATANQQTNHHFPKGSKEALCSSWYVKLSVQALRPWLAVAEEGRIQLANLQGQFISPLLTERFFVLFAAPELIGS